MIIGLDPGLKGHAVALIDPRQGKLERVFFVRASPQRRGANAWAFLASRTGAVLAKEFLDLGVEPSREGAETLLVVEHMQIYSRGNVRRNARPDDLMEINGAVGAVVGYVQNVWRGAVTILDPRPREWKGQVPKSVHHARLTEGLLESEKLLIDSVAQTYRGDALDAYGLAKWGLSQKARLGGLPNPEAWF